MASRNSSTGDSLQFLADATLPPTANSHGYDDRIHNTTNTGSNDAPNPSSAHVGLFTQPPDVHDVAHFPPQPHQGNDGSSHGTNSSGDGNSSGGNNGGTDMPGAPSKKRKSRLKSNRGAVPSVLESTLQTQEEGATTAVFESSGSTTDFAAGTPMPSRSAGRSSPENVDVDAYAMKTPRGAIDRKGSPPAAAAAVAVTPSANHNYNNNNTAVDLTASSSPKRTSPRNNKRKAATQAAEVTPASSKRRDNAKSNASKSKHDIAVDAAKPASLPSPPRLQHPSSPTCQSAENDGKSKKLHPSDVNALPLEQQHDSAEGALATPDQNAAINAAKASSETKSLKDAAKNSAGNPTAATVEPNSTTNGSSAAPKTATPAPPALALAPKKKRTFHDQILYTMLTTCKPYSLKSLAKATDTTVEALHHAMLSFLDKQLVICKEFPSKKGSGEGKKLYWANPISLAELSLARDEDAAKTGKGGKGTKTSRGGVIAKEFGKLLATPQEIQQARQLRQELESRYRTIQQELNPLLAIPTMQELEEECTNEEAEVHKLQGKIQEIKDRIASNAANAKAPRPVHPHHRFQKRPPSPPRDPIALKRRINHMLSEYRARKRKCMDFVEELADAMEKKPKDVMGEKILGLDTDEMEWGTWEDGGKVMGGGSKRGGRGGGVGLMKVGNGRRGAGGKDEKENEAPTVKIPSKYTDV